ncbi:hypothetical protein ASZ90_010380 [hydrocarbon metagenome]|uniref:Uncharacterized protein n=1 Tax=hydrocarbon metagenome TaxID=938273 RepID=A0A0W8FG45_9ZZZZ|nr:hypothetical protein [Methanomicrobiaceae archaeon]
MSHTKTILLLLILCATAGAAGCITASFGEITYNGSALTIRAENAHEPADAVLQVTVASVDTLVQDEVYKQARYVSLDRGANEYTIPVELEPGKYRVYLQLFVGDDRRASVIRDLEV